MTNCLPGLGDWEIPGCCPLGAVLIGLDAVGEVFLPPILGLMGDVGLFSPVLVLLFVFDPTDDGTSDLF